MTEQLISALSTAPTTVTTRPPLSSGANAAQPAPATNTQKALKEFEALVLTEMLRPLFESVETPGIAGGGPGDAVYGALLQEQYATAIADRGGVGIADSVSRALLQQQFSAV